MLKKAYMHVLKCACTYTHTIPIYSPMPAVFKINWLHSYHNNKQKHLMA